MSWNGQVPSQANWQGAPQFPGDEVLYTTPDPATTATNPSIGIVDGNEIPLPTAYNTLAVGTLTSGTINNSGTVTTGTISGTTANLTTIDSTTINNSGTITTDALVANTINGTTTFDARYWANYQAINNVIARDGPFDAYIPNEYYSGAFGLSNVSYGSPYLNYNTAIAGKGLNPGNRLDPFDVNVNYSAFLSSTGATYNDIQYISLNNNTIPAIAPPDPTYWRLAEYQPTRTYTTGELAYITATNTWYTSIAGSTGQAPPNAIYWNVFQRWTLITGISVKNNFWNIDNFNDIKSKTSHVQTAYATTGEITTVNSYTVNAADGNVSGEWRPDTLISRVANVSSILNVGSSGPLGDGGTFKIGYDCLNPISTPAVTIGNSTINKCSVEIFGESNITANNALLVHGGFTVVAGPLGTTVPGSLQNHGISLNAAQVAGVSSVTYTQDLLGLRMVTVLPTQPIQITARAGILELTSQLLGTYIAANTGLYVSQSSGSYGGGRIFTDHICPGYTSGNVLLIDGRNDLTSGVTGVQIDNGTTWNTDTLNATTVNATDVNASGSVTATANVYAVDVVATGNVSAVNVTATGNVSAGVDVNATGNVNGVDLVASGEVNTTLIQSPGVLGMYSDEATAGAFNMIGWGGIQAFTNNTQNAGTIDGNITFAAGGQVSFVAANGGDITFDSTLPGNGLNFPETRDQKFLSGRDIFLTAGNNINATSVGTTTIDAQGNLDLNSATGSTFLDASTEVAISSATSYISLTAGSLQDVKIQSPLDMSTNDIKNVTSVIGNVNLSLLTQTNGNLTLQPQGTGQIVATKNLNMSNNNIINGNTITGQTALTLATSSNGNLNLSPNGTGLIEANAGMDMNNNNIVGGNTITGTTTLTLATTGNNSINISPAGTGQVVINKQVNFSSQTLFNMTLTNVDFIYSRPTGPLRLISQQATSPSVEIRGALTMWANQTTQAPGNSINGVTTLTGQTTLGLATLSNGDLSLSPNGTGTIVATKNLNMSNNSITGGNTITGTSILTLATLSNGNLNLTPDGTGVIVANKTLNMNTNAITNLTTLNGRNLFAYGNFYNTASQTLGAINTATRVVMNTSLNNNLITLDTTTNIGRITFTNAGVYHVVWNAYLIHGSGGTAKSVIWIRLNGTDVAGSGKTENNDSQQNETNMTSSSMVSVTAGQYIEFFWAADSVNVPLTAIAAVAPYPATPSFSCSVSIVG